MSRENENKLSDSTVNEPSSGVSASDVPTANPGAIASVKPETDKNTPISLHRCESYDVPLLESHIREMLDELDCADMFAGRLVVIKPNLVMKKSPTAAATTHPAVLEAMLRILLRNSVAEKNAREVIIAESPPGLYTEAALRGFYRECGISEVAEKYGARLNYDTGAREVELIGAKTLRRQALITPLLDAEVIVNLAKLKSHALTKYSGAVKNFYGSIPGLDKMEIHSRFARYEDFGSALVDICAHHSAKPSFHLLDGILAMEGNGPTGGEVRALNCLIGGRNAFGVDTVGASVAGISGIIMLEEAARRGFCDEVSRLKILGEPISSLSVTDFKCPDSVSTIDKFNNIFGGRLHEWFAPKPIVDRSVCIGCGICKKSCPRSAISLVSRKGKRVAKIDQKTCIRCFCCQELCHDKAVRIHKNPILRLARL